MGEWPRIALGEILHCSNETAVLNPDQEYSEITIKLWGKGVVRRGKVSGSSVATQRRFVRTNQLVLSKIDARHGAIGLVPPELDGAIVTNDFPSFLVCESRIKPEFLGWLVRFSGFVELCRAASEGTTNRVRIKEDRFLKQKIGLPPIDEQHAIVTQLDAVAEKARQVEARLDEIEADACRLLAICFREAIAGAEWRPMAEISPLVRREITIKPEEIYTELGVRSFYKGIFHRRSLAGTDYSWQNLFRVKTGDIIFSNIMAWEQAIGLAGENENYCVGNHRMLTCETNTAEARPGFLWYYFTTDDGFSKILSASPGTAARNKTLKADSLMAIEVPVPKLAQQKAFERLQEKVEAIKIKHADTRKSLKALLPSLLEKYFA
jgi:type I restriction enzyme S subunit